MKKNINLRFKLFYERAYIFTHTYTLILMTDDWMGFHSAMNASARQIIDV